MFLETVSVSTLVEQLIFKRQAKSLFPYTTAKFAVSNHYNHYNHSLSRSRVLLKLTADQVLVFDWIAGSCRFNLLETELGCSMVVQKPIKVAYYSFDEV